jgi:hypothetical protein
MTVVLLRAAVMQVMQKIGRVDAQGIYNTSFSIYNLASVLQGGIAQLGERLHGMQEVSGSIPLTSTTRTSESLYVASRA